MTFREAEILFHNQLAQIYPREEIDSIMHIVFDYVCGFSRFELHLKAEKTIPEKSMPQIYNIIHQLKQHKPIQYILKETEFFGMPFKVNADVLIPRPETEELVQWIISDVKGRESCQILDIGTGSGCIAVSLAKNIENAVVFGVDVSKEAINTAQTNAKLNAVDVMFSVCDILHPDLTLFERFDVIVSNPPYVTSDQVIAMEKNVIDFEPHIALFVPDNDPFVFYEAVALFAREKLHSKGLLYFEINEKYPDETAMIINKYGFTTEIKRDINNKFRMIKAYKNE
jgi:release factor glutamine methyltransferase